MSKKYIGILLVVLLLVLAGISLYTDRDGANQDSAGTSIEGMSEYSNTLHGYTLLYPSVFKVTEYGPDSVGFGISNDDLFSPLAGARITNVSGTPGKSFQEAILHELQDFCATNGAGIVFSCTGIEKWQPATTTSGTVGYQVYITGEQKDLDTDRVLATYSKGPFYVFNMSTSTTARKLLIIHAPIDQNVPESDTELIETIALSFKRQSKNYSVPVPSPEQPKNQSSVPHPPAGQITIQGVMVCLPHRNTSGPQTLECAFGLKDREGLYYGLRDSDPTYKNISGVPMNTPVEIKGVFTPQEDTKYQSIGTIEIESITR